MPHAGEYSRQIRGKDLIPILDAAIRGGFSLLHRNPCAVKTGVEAAVDTDSVVDAAPHGSIIGDIAVNKHALSQFAQPRLRLPSALGVAIDQHGRIATAHELCRCRATDPGTGARDERNLATLRRDADGGHERFCITRRTGRSTMS